MSSMTNISMSVNTQTTCLWAHINCKILNKFGITLLIFSQSCKKSYNNQVLNRIYIVKIYNDNYLLSLMYLELDIKLEYSTSFLWRAIISSLRALKFLSR